MVTTLYCHDMVALLSSLNSIIIYIGFSNLFLWLPGQLIITNIYNAEFLLAYQYFVTFVRVAVHFSNTYLYDAELPLALDLCSTVSRSPFWRADDFPAVVHILVGSSFLNIWMAIIFIGISLHVVIILSYMQCV